jgi:hypothetical protein
MTANRVTSDAPVMYLCSMFSFAELLLKCTLAEPPRNMTDDQNSYRGENLQKLY